MTRVSNSPFRSRRNRGCQLRRNGLESHIPDSVFTGNGGRKTPVYAKLGDTRSLPGNDGDPARLEVEASEHGAPSKIAGIGIGRIKLGT